MTHWLAYYLPPLGAALSLYLAAFSLLLTSLEVQIGQRGWNALICAAIGSCIGGTVFGILLRLLCT